MFELAALRNNLSNGHFGPRQHALVEDLVRRIDADPPPFSGLTLYVLRAIPALVEAGNFAAAADLANLIHDLPAYDDVAGWHEDHFYGLIAPSFFERTENARLVRDVILLVADGQRAVERVRSPSS